MRGTGAGIKAYLVETYLDKEGNDAGTCKLLYLKIIYVHGLVGSRQFHLNKVVPLASPLHFLIHNMLILNVMVNTKYYDCYHSVL